MKINVLRVDQSGANHPLFGALALIQIGQHAGAYADRPTVSRIGCNQLFDPVQGRSRSSLLTYGISQSDAALRYVRALSQLCPLPISSAPRRFQDDLVAWQP